MPCNTFYSCLSNKYSLSICNSTAPALFLYLTILPRLFVISLSLQLLLALHSMKMSAFAMNIICALFLLFLPVLVNSDSHGVTFLYPQSTDITLNYMDTVNVTYLSPFSSPKLYTFCVNTTNPQENQQSKFRITHSSRSSAITLSPLLPRTIQDHWC